MWRFIKLSDVQDMHLASFCEYTQEQNRILCHTSAHTRTHTDVHSECFIKLHLSSQMCLHQPRREEYRPSWGPARFCGSSAYLRDKMETLQGDENREWRMEGRAEGESVQPKVMWQMLKERQTRRQRQKHGQAITGRRGGQLWVSPSVSPPLFWRL